MNFENTIIAFANKSDTELKRAHFLFSFIQYSWLTNILTSLIPALLKWEIPVKGIIRNTIFSQFVGGETLHECAEVASKLGEYQVQTILDYAVEGGSASETDNDKHKEEFIRAIEHASSNANIPYVSLKVSGVASIDLLEKISDLMRSEQGDLSGRYNAALKKLNEKDIRRWEATEKRLHRILGIASLHKMSVLVDAEESWIQDAIDGIITAVMPVYNRNHALVYHTIQLYRKDRLGFLQWLHTYAKEKEVKTGVKLVRGAYMEKESRRAQLKGYSSPIHTDKASVDRDFDAAVDYCFENMQDIEVVLATHNELSCRRAAERIEAMGADRKKIKFYFSQLFGMSDHITFNLAKEGYSVSKYLPYGKVEKVIPYLMRRAQENSSVSGQGSREYELLSREIERRDL